MNRKYIKIVPLLLAGALVFAGCGATKTEGTTADSTVVSESVAAVQTDNNSSEVNITLEGTTAKADSDSVTVSGQVITITEGGTYILSGSLEDGYVIIDVDKEENVQLVLNGVSINSEDFAAIYVLSADEVSVTLAEGTTNTLTNGGSFKAIDDNNVDAVIYSKDDLTLNGEGTLVISSPAGHGIVGKDDVTVTGGSYEISAAQTTVRANDNIDITDGEFTLNAGSDGIHAENNDDDTVGAVSISGGSFLIDAGDDGIHATTTLTISGGSLDITAGEGLEATCITINDGELSIEAFDDGINAAWKSSISTPFVEINGGSVTIVMGAGDTDGIDSNGDIIINGGTVSVTGNSTFDYDGTGVINGGTVIVNGQQITTLPNQMMGGAGGMGDFGGMGDPGGAGGPGGMGMR